MSAKTYSRILDSTEHVDSFLRNVLHLDKSLTEEEFGKYTLKLTSVEMQKQQVLGKDTLTENKYRLPLHGDNGKRKELRKTIYEDLIKKRRPTNEDKICKGKGGALPRTPLQQDRKAFYVIGLPASGKSEVANKLSDQFGAIILDSDYAKRKFPEYDADFGAFVVHEESTVVVFGGKGEFADEPSVLEYAVKKGYNIVIPKIGDVCESIEEFCERLQCLGYEIHIILVRLDREKATARAFKRFIDTGRYVPLPRIFDVYANDPTISFYDLLRKDRIFSSYTMLSSDVNIGEEKKVLLATEGSPFEKECSK